MLTDRHVHRCVDCGAWKLRRVDCPVCAIAMQESCNRLAALRREVEAARREADTIERRRRVLVGAA